MKHSSNLILILLVTLASGGSASANEKQEPVRLNCEFTKASKNFAFPEEIMFSICEGCQSQFVGGNWHIDENMYSMNFIQDVGVVANSRLEINRFTGAIIWGVYLIDKTANKKEKAQTEGKCKKLDKPVL